MFHHPDGLIMVVDKGYRDRATKTWLNETNVTLGRPAYRHPRPHRRHLAQPAQLAQLATDPGRITLIDELRFDPTHWKRHFP